MYASTWAEIEKHEVAESKGVSFENVELDSNHVKFLQKLNKLTKIDWMKQTEMEVPGKAAA